VTPSSRARAKRQAEPVETKHSTAGFSVLVYLYAAKKAAEARCICFLSFSTNFLKNI